MKLDSIQLINYCGHRDTRIDFHPHFNVLVGVNGSGKTSLLRGICDSLRMYCNYMRYSSSVSSLDLNDTTVARLQVETFNGRLRFEPQYPVEVNAKGIAFEKPCKWTVKKPDSVLSPQEHGQSPGQIWQNIYGTTDVSIDEQFSQSTLPVLAFYRASRDWMSSSQNELQAATQRDARTDGYSRWWDASLEASALQIWVIAKTQEKLQSASEASKTLDDIQDDELAIVNKALAIAVENIKGLRYDFIQKSVLVEWHSTDNLNSPTAFENLSDGQRAVICMVADIARRMCLLNPQLGQDVTTQTPGVILIDELDMHLHPHWQRRITTGLKKVFPSVQFIVASHSPQVLGELQPDEIILLRPEGTEHPQVSYGLDSSQILEEIMGTEPRSAEVNEHLSNLFTSIERNELATAKAMLSELKKQAPGIAELAGAEALLKRKEVLGR